MKCYITMLAILLGPLLLVGCNILEGTGRATMDITQGIADDGRAVIRTVQHGGDTGSVAEAEAPINDPDARRIQGTIVSVDRAQRLIVLTGADDKPVAMRFNDDTRYTVNGHDAAVYEALRRSARATITHKGGLALAVDVTG